MSLWTPKRSGSAFEDSSLLEIMWLQKLKIPGLSLDYEVIDGRSMTIHSIATLLMYEALSLKASQVVFSSSSTMAELKAAHECAQDALTYVIIKDCQCKICPIEMIMQCLICRRMAEESRQWVAMSTAQMLLGAIFLKQGDFEDALEHFAHFRKRAAIRCDFEAEAIAFNMIGCCHLGLAQSVFCKCKRRSLFSLFSQLFS